jgi:hypothetical protein
MDTINALELSPGQKLRLSRTASLGARLGLLALMVGAIGAERLFFFLANISHAAPIAAIGLPAIALWVIISLDKSSSQESLLSKDFGAQPGWHGFLVRNNPIIPAVIAALLLIAVMFNVENYIQMKRLSPAAYSQIMKEPGMPSFPRLKEGLIVLDHEKLSLLVLSEALSKNGNYEKHVSREVCLAVAAMHGRASAYTLSINGQSGRCGWGVNSLLWHTN